MVAEKKFNPAEHFRKVQGGRDYLEVKYRLLWWREEHPEGHITTELIHADYSNGYYVVKATVGWCDAQGRDVHATGHKSEAVRDFADALEKAETGAVGRALALLGYGTEQALELDEDSRVVDGPATREPRPITQHQPTEADERKRFYQLLDGDPKFAVWLGEQKINAHQLPLPKVRQFTSKLQERAQLRAQAVHAQAPPEEPPPDAWNACIEKARVWLDKVAGQKDGKPYATDTTAAVAILAEQEALLGATVAGAKPVGADAIRTELARRQAIMIDAAVAQATASQEEPEEAEAL
jgi:hypothetical protein